MVFFWVETEITNQENFHCSVILFAPKIISFQIKKEKKETKGSLIHIHIGSKTSTISQIYRHRIITILIAALGKLKDLRVCFCFCFLFIYSFIFPFVLSFIALLYVCSWNKRSYKFCLWSHDLLKYNWKVMNDAFANCSVRSREFLPPHTN